VLNPLPRADRADAYDAGADADADAEANRTSNA